MLTVNSNGTIQLTRGDSAELAVTILNKDDNSYYEIGEADKLTFSVKRSVKTNEYALQKEVVGTSIIPIDPADTASLEFAKYQYDVQLTTAAGKVFTVIAPSTFEITAEVTC